MISSEIEPVTTNHDSVKAAEGKQFKMKALMATSLDYRHGIENIVDGRINTFWISTGLFPQEVIIALSTSVLLKTVTLTTMKVSHVILEASNTNIKEFKTINSQEIQDGTIQTTSFSIPPGTKARYLKFIFKKGYADFITVHKLNVTGDPLLETTANTTASKEKSSKTSKTTSTKSEAQKTGSNEEVKDKIVVRQTLDSSTGLKSSKPSHHTNLNSTSNSTSNSSSMVDVERTTGSKHHHHSNKKSNNTTSTTAATAATGAEEEEDNSNNLTDIATELQSSYSSRRESRKLSKASSQSTEGSGSGHHSKSKRSGNTSSKLKESTNVDDL